MADEQSTPQPPGPGPITPTEAIALLLTDVKAWNKWRKENSGVELPALRKADLREADLREANLREANLREANLFEANLSNADLRHANLRNANLYCAHLEGARLYKAHLEGARLAQACLQGAELFEARLEGAELQSAHLQGANFWSAHLQGAVLWGANLERADLSHALLEGAFLDGARLEGANLSHAHLEGADLRAADFSNANVTGLTYDRKRGRFRGIRVATCYGNALFVRDARDQDYIETRAEALGNDWRSWKERKEQQRQELEAERPGPHDNPSWSRTRKWIKLWKLTYLDWVLLVGGSAWMRLWSWIDYGRSLWRVGVAASVVAMIFGVVFHVSNDMLKFTSDQIADSWSTPYYYSIVTYTTLGFGDVTPITTTGQIVVAAEVILGYLTLGLLVSILANNVARRA